MRPKIYEDPRGSYFSSLEIKKIEEILLKKNNPLTRGPEIEIFENNFSKYVGIKHSISTSSCSAALRIAFQMIKLKKNDEVIVPANAFWNSVNPILEHKCKIVVVDIKKYNLTICTDDLSKKITKKTKAILILNFGGNTCDFLKIKSIISNKKIYLIEDCAHSLGSFYRNRHSGSFSDISCFSFSTLKNISTLGEGGMVCTNNKIFADLADKLRNCYPIGKQKEKLNNHIIKKLPKDYSFLRPGDYVNKEWIELDALGSRYTMTSIQAAVGTIQLKNINKFLKKRKKIANLYLEFFLSKKEFKILKSTNQSQNSWHLFPVFIKNNKFFNRNQFVEKLSNKYGIEIINRYWPIHLNNLVKNFTKKKYIIRNYEYHWFHDLFFLPISANTKYSRAKEMIKRINLCYSEFLSLHANNQ